MRHQVTDSPPCHGSGDTIARSMDQWQKIISDEVSQVELVGGEEAGFEGRFSKRRLAQASVFRVDSAAQTTRRTSSGISRDGRSDICLAYVATGEMEYRQHGRDFFVRPNSCFALDFGSPFEMSVFGRSQYLSVKIPRNIAENHSIPERLNGYGIYIEECWGSVLSSYLRALYINFYKSEKTSPNILFENLIQIFGLALGGEPQGKSSHQRGILRRIHSIMQEVYCEEDLNPAAVATMAGVSKSYMYKLFAQAETTFCRELDVLRIDRAAALLESLNQVHLTINEIGIRCGLPDAAHFSRKFRALKGMSPSRYRDSTLSECARQRENRHS